MTEKELAKKSQEVLRVLIQACENDGPVYQALEDCRYALLEIIDE